jgi:hypothetical protein
MALNELKLFLTDDPAITGYTDGGEFGGSATRVWDLGDAVVLMDYALESGSGASDVSFFVKSSVFSTPEDCSYGSTDCTTYLVMWNEYGNYSDSALYPSRTWENNDGFEEWGVVLRPVVEAEKTAEGTYETTIDWTITKSVDPDSHTGWFGDDFVSDYDVFVDKTEVSGNYAASGTITIFNPTGEPGSPVEEDVPAIIQSVEDVIAQGVLTTDATVDCGVTFPYTLGGGETLICSYSASTPNAESGTNTATITVEVPEQIGGGTDTYEATADLTFEATLTGYPTINVTDYFDGDLVGDPLGSASDDYTFEYTRDFACPTDEGMYTDGVYTRSFPNYAEFDETGQQDDANVDMTCYAPVVEKDANPYFTRYWDWTIEKWGDQTVIELEPGETFPVNYEVTVDATFTDNDWGVSGSIWVTNPNPGEAMVLTSVSDVAGGIPATVKCPSLTVPAGGLLTCTYDTGPQDSEDLNPFGDTNVATVVFAAADWTAEADIIFSTDPTDGFDECIDVSDDAGTPGDPTDDEDLGSVCANETLPHTFLYTLIVGPYSIDECETQYFINTAEFVTNDNFYTGFDTWTVTVEMICDFGCTLTQGYWKTHSDFGPAPYDPAWENLGPLGEDELFFDTGYTYIQIMYMNPSGGNAYLILAHQWIAAYLNVLNGASIPGDVLDAWNDAALLLDKYEDVVDIPKGTDDREDALGYAYILDQYNNGYLGPGHCEP